MPGVPLRDELPPVLKNLGRTLRLGRSVLLVEDTGELAERLADPLLVLFWEKRRRTRAPEELLEAIEVLALELLALEVPDGVTGVGLKKEERGESVAIWMQPVPQADNLDSLRASS